MIARNCDWFMALFVPVVIGRSTYFGFGFSTVIFEKRSNFSIIQSCLACKGFTHYAGSKIGMRGLTILFERKQNVNLLPNAYIAQGTAKQVISLSGENEAGWETSKTEKRSFDA